MLKCVTSVKYTITHGEHEMGPIVPSRGIRQGDPLSPYLFIICAEGFSALLRKYELKQLIHGVKISRKAPMVSHMLFADDSYLFCKADPVEAKRILEILEMYEKASGQKVNRTKSSIFYSSNVLLYNKDSVGQCLQMVEADEHSTYLGLPNLIGRNKSALLGFLKDKVYTKIRSWEGNYISRSGKEILVKQVAQTLPSYAMNVFLLPLEITRHIEKSLTKFWWNSSQTNKSRLNWMSWERMAKHKNAGGMGFRHFRDFNIAMLGKQLWRLASNPNSLVSRMYKAKYYDSSDIFHAELGHNPSFIWRSLLEAKSLFTDGARWRVGDGSRIQILEQPWLLSKKNPYITSSPDPLQGNVVASLLCVDRKECDLDVVKDMLNERDQASVLAILLSEANNEDQLYWCLEETGNYSVKSAYRLLQTQRGDWNQEENDKLWQILWSTKATPKALNTVWRALSQCLPTLTQLQQKRVNVQNICPVCQEEVETIEHTLVNCRNARQCWIIMFPGIQLQVVNCFKSWLKLMFDNISSSKHADVVTLCWSIWRSRNDVVWNQRHTKVTKTVADARQYLIQWKITQTGSYVTPLQPLVEGDGALVWVKPQPNKIKVSVDAAVFDDRGGVGFGLVARDSDGQLIEAKAIFQPNVFSPLLAETMAFKEALSWMETRGWTEATVESDCLVMVQAVRSTTSFRSYFGLLIEDCRNSLLSLNNVKLFYVKRSANMVAHQVARESYFVRLYYRQEFCS